MKLHRVKTYGGVLDGMHLDKDAHKKLAHLVTDKIKKCLMEQKQYVTENEDDGVYIPKCQL